MRTNSGLDVNPQHPGVSLSEQEFQHRWSFMPTRTMVSFAQVMLRILLSLCFLVLVRSQNVAQHCVGSGICFKLSIPSATAESGQGDVFFQIAGPTSNSWIALGQGSQMSGSNIFVVYANGNGNVTVSPRKGAGHVEPDHWTVPEVNLLAGSGINNNTMVANIRCSNCQNWQEGSMDFGATSATWIFAQRSGPALQSTDLDQEIQQHEDHGSFVWDMAAAKGAGTSVNPFTSSTAVISTMSGDTKDDDDDDNKMLVLAHGACAGLAFLGLFPIGGILVRLTGHAWIHGGVQSLAYLVFVAAAGMGIYIAKKGEKLDEHHPIIGMVLLGALFFQPLLGVSHHYMFKKHGGRTSISHIHIWMGRVLVVLGMINGGLGLQLARQTTTAPVVGYSVTTAVMFVAWMGFSVHGELMRTKDAAHTRKGSDSG